MGRDDTPGYERVLSFWFGQLDDEGCADDEHSRRWWMKDEAFDALLRREFLADHRAVTAGEREEWLAAPRGRLAYVIVLDQLSRNMFRGTPEMFASDDQALRAALDGIARGDDLTLALDERSFLYMPLMHSESLAHQERCVELFRALRDETRGRARERVETSLDFAEQHRDIIARFGRFPHRNAILGRTSTAEELAFLEQPGSSF